MSPQEISNLLAQAEIGDVRAMNQLTLVYGQDAKYKDFSQAVKWFHALAQKENAQASQSMNIQYDRVLRDKIITEVDNAISEQDVPGLLKELHSGSYNTTSLLPKPILFVSTETKQHVEAIRILERKRIERLERESLERERLEKERLEKERLERERLEQERLKRERIEKELPKKIETDYKFYEAPFRNITGHFVIPDGVKHIGDFAFANSGLTSIYIPNTLNSIGKRAFACISSLTSFNIPLSVKSIGEGAFWKCPLNVIFIPSNVEHIDASAFGGCEKLSCVVIANAKIHVEPNVFIGCSSLKHIIVPTGTKNNFDSSFGKNYIKKIVEATRPIEDNLLDNNWIIAEIKEIERLQQERKEENTKEEKEEQERIDAERVDQQQKTIELQNDNTPIEKDVEKMHEDNERLAKEKEQLEKEQREQEQAEQKRIEQERLEKERLEQLKQETLTTIKQIETDYGFRNESPFKDLAGHLDIPDGTSRIGAKAFRKQAGLTHVTIPNSVTQIGEAAFEDCSGIEIVNILNGETQIEKFAFAGCQNLKQVIVPQGTKERYKKMVKSIWHYGALSSKIVEEEEQDFV